MLKITLGICEIFTFADDTVRPAPCFANDGAQMAGCTDDRRQQAYSGHRQALLRLERSSQRQTSAEARHNHARPRLTHGKLLILRCEQDLQGRRMSA